MKLRKLLSLTFAGLLLASVSFADPINTKKLDRISMGMSAKEIISILGEPDLRRLEGTDSTGKTMERLQYTTATRLKEPLPNGDLELKRPCSFLLADGNLVRIER